MNHGGADASPMPHAHRLRTSRSSVAGGTYVCTCVVRDRETVLADLSLGRMVVDAMRTMDANGATSTIAFVVMPNHLHWMFVLGEHANLTATLQYMKQRSAHRINATTERRGRLWQRGFHDHAVRSDENLRALARYIVHNPVRAGVVRSLRDYALWDAMWL